MSTYPPDQQEIEYLHTALLEARKEEADLRAQLAAAQAEAARLREAAEEIEILRTALADAIRRPMGVIPASAEGHITDEEICRAEEHRMKFKPDGERLHSSHNSTEASDAIAAYNLGLWRKSQAQLASAQAELADRRDSDQRVLSEQCPSDERHCACVPALRREVEMTQTEAARLRDALEPFVLLNPSSKRVMAKWDGYVTRARAALAKEGGENSDPTASAGGACHRRLVRPLPISGEADCPKCGCEKSVSRHNADWTCQAGCGFHELTDHDREWCRCENPGPHYHPGSRGKFCAVCGNDTQPNANVEARRE